METIKEAKDYLKARMKKGAKCPCCSQFVKLYEIKLSTAMVKSLVMVYQHTKRFNPESGWIHIPSRLPGLQRSRSYPKLAHWGLLEECKLVRRNGYWRITDAGKMFVEGHSSIPSAAYIYNKQCWGFKADTIDIDSVKHRFNFAEIMREI